MAQFRVRRLDLGGYINPRIIRDHTKRKVFEQHEPERFVAFLVISSQRVCLFVTADNHALD